MDHEGDQVLENLDKSADDGGGPVRQTVGNGVFEALDWADFLAGVLEGHKFRAVGS